MKTALYARKSTESEDRQIQSIDDQLAAMKALAKREGIQIDETYVESRSAKAPYTRPEFKRLMDDIEAGRITRLLVWNMSRLSRNLVDGGLVAYLLQTGKLEWIRTTDRVYRPEDNALLLSIENGMATSFIQDLRKNVVRGMDGKADRGWRPGRAPLGYVNNQLTREIDPDPVRFPLVRKAWDMLLTGGYAPSQIFYEMEKMGLTSTAKRRTSRPLSMGVIYSMFSNPFYKGLFRYQGRERQGKHKAMVTAEEFEAAQEILGRSPLRRKRKRDFAYAGLLRCGRCGCMVVADRRTKHYAGTGRTVNYVYYHCTNGRGGCSKKGVPEKMVAEEFERTFESIAIPESFARWAIDRCVQIVERNMAAIAAGQASVTEEAAAWERKLERLREMRIDEEITADEYREQKGKVERELSHALSRKEEALDKEESALRRVREKFLLAAAAEGYEDEEFARRRGMALALGGIHYLTLGELRISMHPLLRKVAALGPLRNSSETPKMGDFVPANSFWCTFIEDILTSAREAEKDGPGEDPFDRLDSIKRYRGTAERM